MGMYDSIKIKKKLTLPKELKHLNIDWKNHEFQTKDLENCLLNYFIEKDGTLWEEVVEREYIYYTEEEKKKLKPNPFRLFKDVIETLKDPVKVDHHGVINFYTYESFNEEEDFWLEYDAYFVYGKLDKIKLKKFYTEKSRKQSLEKWKEEEKQRQKKPWNVFKRYANKAGWGWFWRKVCRGIDIIEKILYKTKIIIFRDIL